MAEILYDIAAETGTYQKDGQTKTRFLTVGVIMQGENGKPPYQLLASWFNPAALSDGKSTRVLLHLFPHKKASNSNSPAQSRNAPGRSQNASDFANFADMPVF